MSLLDENQLRAALGALDPIDQALGDARRRALVAEGAERRPLHTVYGGAHLFRADLARRLGQAALRHVETYFPDFVTLAEALELEGWESLPRSTDPRVARIAELEQDLSRVPDENRPLFLAAAVYRRTIDKLEREPVEDFRIDFEDGFGPRDDEQEDREALRVADELALGIEQNLLPPFVGIRIQSFGRETRHRAVRTLDLLLGRLLERTGGRLPPGFVVTLPKIEHPEQVAALVRIFEAVERETDLAAGSLRLELMIETPASIYAPDGRVALPALVEAAAGRCIGAHLGVYDYTASLGIVASHQAMGHPACDHARQIMQVALAGTGVVVCDGATHRLPIAVHRQTRGGPPLTEREEEENHLGVHEVSRRNYLDIRHSLRLGIYQGWDLHPSQLPIRYAAVYAFFLEALGDSSRRLRTFVERSARATRLGEVFDDAATGQGLLAFFLRGLACGAITREEATATGLDIDEIAGRSFQRIVENRRQGQNPPR